MLGRGADAQQGAVARGWPGGLLPGRRAFLLLVAVPLGLALGIGGLVLHLQTDPLADLHAYYDAGARLNAGEPLYQPGATSPVGLYLYPPLLAILFRPLATLPFEVVAVAWEAAMVAAFAATLWVLGLRPVILVVVAVLAMPITWALSIGQLEPLVTLLLAWGSPLTIAVAGQLKLAPLLVATYWLARGESMKLVLLAAWSAALAVLQLVLEPAATLDYLRLEWTAPAFGVRSISPFAIHPAVWAAMVGVLLAVAWRRARTDSGWAWAVVLAVLAYPRLLAYQLMSLLAGFGGPDRRRDPAARAGAAEPGPRHGPGQDDRVVGGNAERA